MEELKRCPFRCDGDALDQVRIDGKWQYRCLQCGAMGPKADTIDGSRAAWNRREGEGE